MVKSVFKLSVFARRSMRAIITQCCNNRSLAQESGDLNGVSDSVTF